MASELVEKYRKSLQAKGHPSGSFSDLQLTLEVHRMLVQGNEDIDDYGEDFASDVRAYMQLPKPGREGLVGALKEFPAGAHSSYEQKKGSYKSFGAVGAGAVGADETADDLMLSSRVNMEKAARVGPSIRDIEYVDSLGGLGRWFLGAAGEVVVDAAEILGSMGVGKLVGGAAAAKATTTAKKGAATANELQDIAKKAKDSGFMWGTALGAVGTSTAQNTGQVYADLYPYTQLPEYIEDENGVKTPNPNYLDPATARAMSFGAGTASGALDSVVPFLLVKSLVGKGVARSKANAAVGNMLSKMPANLTWMPGVVSAGAGEALTESAQEMIQMLTVKSHTGEEWGAQDWNRVKNAGALGAVGGTVLGGGVQGLKSLAGQKVDGGDGSSPVTPSPTPGDPEGGFTARDMERVNAMVEGSFVQRALSPKSGIVTKNFGDGMIEVQYPDGKTSVENGSVFIQREDLTAKKFTDHEIENMDSHALENLLQTGRLSKEVEAKMESVIKARKAEADPESDEATAEPEYATVSPDGLAVEFKDGNVQVFSTVGGKRTIYATAELAVDGETYILKDKDGAEHRINFAEGLGKDLQDLVQDRLHDELASKAVKDKKMVFRAQPGGKLHKVWPGLDKLNTMTDADLYEYNQTIQNLVVGGQSNDLKPVLAKLQAEMRSRSFYVKDEKGNEFVPGNPDGDGTPMQVASVYTQLVNELKAKDVTMTRGQLGNHIKAKSREFAREFDISDDSANKVAAQARKELARIEVYDGNKVTKDTAFDLEVAKAKIDAKSQETIAKRKKKVKPLEDKEGHYVEWGQVPYRIKGISEDDGMVTLEPFDGETITVDYNGRKGSLATKKTISDGEFTYEFDGKKERKYKDVKVTKDDTDLPIKSISAADSKLRMVFDETGENFRLFDTDDYQRSGLTGLFPNTDQGILDAKKRWAEDVGEKDTSGISKYWKSKRIQQEGTRRVKRRPVLTGWTQVVEYDEGATEEAFDLNPDTEPVISSTTYESSPKAKIFRGKIGGKDTVVIPAFSEHEETGTIYVSGYKVIPDKGDYDIATLPEVAFKLDAKHKGSILVGNRAVVLEGIRTDGFSTKFPKAAGLTKAQTSTKSSKGPGTPPAIKERELAPEGIEGYTISEALGKLGGKGFYKWSDAETTAEGESYPQGEDSLREHLVEKVGNSARTGERSSHRHVVLEDAQGRVLLRPVTKVKDKAAVMGMESGGLYSTRNKTITGFQYADQISFNDDTFTILGYLDTEAHSGEPFSKAPKTKIIADFESVDAFRDSLGVLTSVTGNPSQKYDSLKNKPELNDADRQQLFDLENSKGEFDPKAELYGVTEEDTKGLVEELRKYIGEDEQSKHAEDLAILDADIRMTTLHKFGLSIFKNSDGVTARRPSHWLGNTGFEKYTALRDAWKVFSKESSSANKLVKHLEGELLSQANTVTKATLGDLIYGEQNKTIIANSTRNLMTRYDEGMEFKERIDDRYRDGREFLQKLLDVDLSTNEDGVLLKNDTREIEGLIQGYSKKKFEKLAGYLSELDKLRKGKRKHMSADLFAAHFGIEPSASDNVEYQRSVVAEMLDEVSGFGVYDGKTITDAVIEAIDSGKRIPLPLRKQVGSYEFHEQEVVGMAFLQAGNPRAKDALTTVLNGGSDQDFYNELAEATQEDAERASAEAPLIGDGKRVSTQNVEAGSGEGSTGNASQLSIPSLDNPGIILSEESLRKYTDNVLRDKFGTILGHVSEVIADPQVRQQNVQENTEAVAEFMKGAKLDGKPISGDLTLQRVQELADESTQVGKMAMNLTRWVAGHPLLKKTKVFWNTWENYRNNTEFESGRYKLAVTYGNKIVMGDTYKLSPDSPYTAKEHLLFTVGEELVHSITSSTLEAATHVGVHNELPGGWPHKTLAKDELRKLYRDSERMLGYLRDESKRGGTLYRPQLTNIHEMWAGFVSNPGFRDWVGGLDALPSTLKNDVRSPFRQVYDWFVRILNRILSRNPDTRVLSVLDDQFKKLVKMSKELHSYEAPVAGLFSQLSFDFDAKPWVAKSPGEDSVQFDYSKYVGSPSDPNYARRVADHLIVDGSPDLDGDIAYQWHKEYGLSQQVLLREMNKAHRRRMASKIRRGHASEEELVPYMTKESANLHSDLKDFEGLALAYDSKATHEVDPVMFSKALEVAKDLPQEKGTPEQFISMMKKSGVKEEELRDLKLINHDGSLVYSPKHSTKQALIDHIELHSPQFSERLMEERTPEPPPPVIKGLLDARDASRVAQHERYWWMPSTSDYSRYVGLDDFHRAWLANDLDGLVGKETADALREEFGEIDLGIKWDTSGARGRGRRRRVGGVRIVDDRLAAENADMKKPGGMGFYYGTKEKPIDLEQNKDVDLSEMDEMGLYYDEQEQMENPPILGFRLEKNYANTPFFQQGLIGTANPNARHPILTRESGMQTTSAHMALSQLVGLYTKMHNYTEHHIDDSDTVPYSQFTVKGGKNYRILKISLPMSSEIKDSGVDQHFEEDNLGWIRFTERETTDGKSVLFIEEIQSDPAQKIDKAKARQWVAAGSDPNNIEDYSADMPFKKSWPEVMLKRMTRWAVDNGFDSIAWVSADIQRERNRLESKEDGFFEAIYDRTLRNAKLWKRLGVKPERGAVSDINPVANGSNRARTAGKVFSAEEKAEDERTGGKVFSPLNSKNLKDIYIVDLSGITHLPPQPSYASSEELSPIAPRDPELEKASVATSMVEAAGASLNEAEAVMASVLSEYTEEELDSDEMKAILAQLQRLPTGEHVRPEVVKSMLEKTSATIVEGREAIMSIADTGKMVNDFGNANIKNHAMQLSLNLAEGYRRRMQELRDEDDQTLAKVEKRVREHKEKLKAVVDRIKGADQARAKKELTEEFIRVLEDGDAVSLLTEMGARPPLNFQTIASEVDADKLYDVLDGIADADYEIEALSGEQAFQQLAGVKSEQVGVAPGNDALIQAALARMLGNEGRNKITQTHFTMALRISKNRLAGSLAEDYKLLNRMASDEDYDRIPTDGAFGTALKNIKKQRDQLKEASSGLNQNRLRSKVARDMETGFTNRVDDFRAALGELPPVTLVEGHDYSYVRFKRDKNGDLTEEVEELKFKYKLPNDTSSPESKAQMNIAKEILDVVNSDAFRKQYGGTPYSHHMKGLADELAKVPFAHQYQLAHYGAKLGFLQSFSQTFGRAGAHGATIASAINGVTRDHAAEHTKFYTQGLLVGDKVSALHKLLDPTVELPLFIDKFYNSAMGWLNDNPDIPEGDLSSGARKLWSDFKKRGVYGHDYSEKAFEAFKSMLVATDQQNSNFMALNKKYGHRVKDDSMEILSFVTGDVDKLYRREVGQGAITMPRSIDRERITSAAAALANQPMNKGLHVGNKVTEILGKVEEILGTQEPGSKSAIAELLGKNIKDDLHDTVLDPFISQVGAHSQFYHIKVGGKKEFLFPERMASVWRSLAHEKPGARLHKFIDEIAGGDLTDEAYAEAAKSFLSQLERRADAVLKGYSDMTKSQRETQRNPLNITQYREMDHSLNGRSLANYLPSSYFRYMTNDAQNSLQRLGRIIQAHHFGRDGDKLTEANKALVDELDVYVEKYNRIAKAVGIKQLTGETPPSAFKSRIYRLIESKTGVTKQEFRKIRDAAALFTETGRAWTGLNAFLKDSESWNMDNKGTMEALGTISFLAVNNPKSSFMGAMSIPDLVKRLGLNPTGLRAVGDTLMGLPKEIAGTFLERFGLDILSATQYEEMINPFYVDLDQSLTPAERRSDIGKRGELTQDGFRRNLRKLKHVLTQAGGSKNRAKLGGGKFVPGSLRTALTNPFSYSAQVVNKRITMSFVKLLHRRVLNAADVLDDMGIDPNDNSTELSAEDLGFKDTKMDRLIFGNKAMIEWLNNRLAQEGSSLTRLAQSFRKRRLEDANALPIDLEGARRAWSIAMSEVTYDATSGKSMLTSHGKGKFFGFLLNWSLASFSQANMMIRNQEGKIALRESLRYAIVSSAWLMPIGVAMTLWTDWWDEKILGKPSNLRKVPPILGAPVIGLPLAMADPRWNAHAFLERTGRASNVGGAGQEIMSQVLGGFDPTTPDADFSRRVLFIGATTNALAAMKNYLLTIDTRRGETFIPDYSQVVRPLMYSVGLNGLLQHAQASTNLVPPLRGMPFLSEERRVSDIIGMRNILRAHAKVLGMEMRSSRGMSFLPSPVTVAVRKMERAAYANDTEDFLSAYRTAIAVSNAEEPHKHVIEKFKTQTIRNGITRYTMSDQDWNVLLSVLGDEEKERILGAQRSHDYYLTLIGGKPRASRSGGTQYSEELRRLALD